MYKEDTIRQEILDCKEIIRDSAKSGTCLIGDLQDHDCDDFDQMYARIRALNWVLDDDVTVLLVEDTDQIVIEMGDELAQHKPILKEQWEYEIFINQPTPKINITGWFPFEGASEMSERGIRDYLDKGLIRKVLKRQTNGSV